MTSIRYEVATDNNNTTRKMRKATVEVSQHIEREAMLMNPAMNHYTPKENSVDEIDNVGNCTDCGTSRIECGGCRFDKEIMAIDYYEDDGYPD